MPMPKRPRGNHGLNHKLRGQRLIAMYGELSIGTLRHIYNGAFASAFQASHRLGDVIAMLDRPSLDLLLRDFHSGVLESKVIADTIDTEKMQGCASLNI